MTALQWIALCFAFVRLAAFQEIAQAYWLAETRSARIGEPVMLTLQANLPAGSQVEWPALPSSSVMLTQGGELVRQPGAGIDTYSQAFTVTIWEWGEHTLPPMTISYQQDDTPAQQISPAPIVIQIVSTVTEDDQMLRPLKPPLALPFVPRWLIMIPAFVIGIALIAGIAYLRQRKPQHSPDHKLIQVRTIQTILSELDSIQNQSLPPATQVIEADGWLRLYLQQRFKLGRTQHTTTELMALLKRQSSLSKEQFQALRVLLEGADRVKFADVDAGQQLNFVQMVSQWIRATEQAAD